ncbi:hypothetical protein ACHAW6_001390 [Cyclotella cf. meneghiniana]
MLQTIRGLHGLEKWCGIPKSQLSVRRARTIQTAPTKEGVIMVCAHANMTEAVTTVSSRNRACH